MAHRHNLISLFACLALVVANVSGQNPTLDYFLEPVYVAEDPTVLTKLAQLNCKTFGGTTIKNIKLKTVSPSGPFTVQENPVGEYWVVYDTTQDLNYASNNFYDTTITCTDSSNQPSNTVSLFIYVTPNKPPTITGYPRTTVTLDASTFDYTTDTAITVKATDPESDTLTYYLSAQQPSSGLFSINSATGKITANNDLKLVSTSSYVLTVEVSDGKNTVSDFNVDITIDNLNVPPVIRNLPTSISVAENAAAGTTLIKLAIEDLPSPTLKTTCTTFPASEAYKFTLNPDDTITLSANNLLNYEARSVYTISCTTTDGYFNSDGKDVLTVNVLNVNEPPSFNSNQYYCALVEGAARDHYYSLTLSVSDPEGETVTNIDFVPSADSGNFFFDKSTNRIYFDQAYDVDPKLRSTSLSLKLQAKDSGGATATATVLITVTDDNDSTCSFDTSTMYFQSDQSTPLGILGTFTVTDADLTSPNKDTRVDVVSSTPADAGSYITVSSTGQVFYSGAIPQANTGTSYTILVKCRDFGSPSRSAQATVVVSYTYITTTSTTTTTTTTATTSTTAKPEKSVWDFDWFLAVFSIFLTLVALLLIAGLAYLIYKCCCQPKTDTVPRSKVSPQTGEKKSSRRSYYDDDDDYMTSARSDYRYGRTWQSIQPISPRQIPALEYR